MAKEKKSKKAKKPGKGGSSRTDALKALANNPIVADIVAAALVATASALKDSKRARALATDSADELSNLSKAGAKRGEALWDMALQIGRRSLDALTAGEAPERAKAKPAVKKKPSKKVSTKKKPAGSGSR